MSSRSKAVALVTVLRLLALKPLFFFFFKGRIWTSSVHSTPFHWHIYSINCKHLSSTDRAAKRKRQSAAIRAVIYPDQQPASSIAMELSVKVSRGLLYIVFL